MTGLGAIMMRQENDRLPSEVQEPQRLAVSLKRTAFALRPTAASQIAMLSSRVGRPSRRAVPKRRRPQGPMDHPA